ncbi:type IV pilus assembly PilZ [Magnetococcus marinus MC-1]|uniref:Type IV pilus assembly PilZ n=1 Tax=Magnetococcus marinus (strain ATCC BAA-1437 / JCM 17883 / MC-1) TaxID=156889 RepID=A0L8Y5_MAGMM|nr:PilZ domain-containing protein [Magnetococcus marinus]ABK44428.1 type IV pilus assembly PilZ [Magnetococcus marinus MC-1]
MSENIENHAGGAADVARQEERKPFVTELIFYASDGTVYTGHTTDVSLSGAFLHTQLPEHAKLSSGDEGVVELTLEKAGNRYTMSFPCKVARITPAGIGLFFDEVDEEGDALDHGAIEL